jgi:hypothetical protein
MQMKSIKLGLSLIAALVFSVAMTTSASAQSFLSSAKEKLLSTNVAKQVFVTEAGTTECTKAPITSGNSSGMETTEQTATVKYEGCTAFGFAEVTISPVEYTFRANGEVLIDKISFVTTGCEVSVPAQTVSKVDFATKGSNILLEPLVTGILYTATGSFCAKTGEFKNGTYKGHSEVMIATGSLSFMAGGGEEEAGLSVTPNPLVFTPKSGNEEPITLAAAGAAGDEVEIITGGVGAITVTEGTAGWVKLKGANCESKVLVVAGATCVEKMQDVAFPKTGETFRAEYEITWKSIKPASIILHTTTVKLRAEN